MKKWFIGLGIAFIFLAVGTSAILLIARTGVAPEEIIIPDQPVEPKGGVAFGTRIPSNATTAEQAAIKQAEADEAQAAAINYQAAVQKYQTKLTAYNDALNRRAQAEQQRKTYMLYLIIVVGILGILAFASFLVAFTFTKGQEEKKVVVLDKQDEQTDKG